MFFLLIRRVDWWLHLDWCHFPHIGASKRLKAVPGRNRGSTTHRQRCLCCTLWWRADRPAVRSISQYIVSKFRFRPNIARELVITVRFVGSCLLSYSEIIVDLQQSACVHIFFQSMTICQVAICCHFDRTTALNLRLWCPRSGFRMWKAQLQALQ